MLNIFKIIYLIFRHFFGALMYIFLFAIIVLWAQVLEDELEKLNDIEK